MGSTCSKIQLRFIDVKEHSCIWDFLQILRVDTQQPYRQKLRLTVELSPHAYVRESVLDYIRMRREAGATAKAVIRMLLNYRNKVIVAPTGHFGIHS